MPDNVTEPVKPQRKRKARRYIMVRMVENGEQVVAEGPSLKSIRSVDLIDGATYYEAVQIGSPFTASIEVVQKVSRNKVK